jgi:hypothetical protein
MALFTHSNKLENTFFFTFSRMKTSTLCHNRDGKTSTLRLETTTVETTTRIGSTFAADEQKLKVRLRREREREG